MWMASRNAPQMVSEDRPIGYQVVYEYVGRQHTAQLPFAPDTQAYAAQPPVVATVVSDRVFGGAGFPLQGALSAASGPRSAGSAHAPRNPCFPLSYE